MFFSLWYSGRLLHTLSQATQLQSCCPQESLAVSFQAE